MGSDTAKPSVAFYTVSDRRYFLGLVGLLNSLRLMGHDEPVVVVDAGLTTEQRQLLTGHVTLLPAPSDTVSYYLFPVGPMRLPADVMVVIDADIIVTRPLTSLVQDARDGRIVAFVDPLKDRFHPEWQTALGLGPLRRHPYLNAGMLAFPESLGDRLLPMLTQAQQTVDVRQTKYGGAKELTPFYFGDQDMINALLASRFTEEESALLEHRLAPHPPFPGLRCVDERRLLCRYPDGTEPFVLHHITAKPWLRATASNVYSRLLSRLLLAPDVALRLEPQQVPLRLRHGRLASVDRARADLADGIREELLWMHRLGIRTRLAKWRAGHATG
ncbi:hypothetical protein [Streptomyces sp. HUAS ZL42]|uniref:hypothetical protein n=1 Tax=Streptomyces sp. HUAS ZL42 TaxID=3231715 RepID=UPI00345E621F